MSALLEVEELSVAVDGQHKIRDISFEVDEGEILAVLGPNGAGKTTLMRALSRLIAVQGGRVTWCGKPLPARAHLVARSGLRLAPQDHPIFADLTVRENLAVAGRGKDGASATDNAVRLFPELKPLLGRAAGGLSGGQRQMLSISQALATRPLLLMLDEPSSGLAPKVVTAVFAALQTVARDGVSVLIVEQNAAQTLTFAQHALVLEHGRVAMRGAAAELAGNDHIKRAYLGL